MRRPLAILAAALLAGCTLGPDFKPPEGPKPAAYLPDGPMAFVAGGIEGGEAQRIVQDLDIPGQWWMVFQSTELNGLIDQALRANPDIRAAAAGLKMARENARAQRATLFPTLQSNFKRRFG